MASPSNGELSQTEAHEPQQETFEDGRIEVETGRGENLCEDEPRSSEFEWIIRNLNQAEQDNNAQSWAEYSIYRIPHYLKDGNEKAYIPQIVSLCPYHHGDKRLREKDKDKWRGLMHMLRRNNQRIEEYLDAVTRVEEQARNCYEGTIIMSSNEFIMMMVLDGCFMIELFQGYFHGFDKLGYTHNDPIFSSHILIDKIRRDMILLENQIPLLILHQLFYLQVRTPDQDELLAKVALYFFYNLTPTDRDRLHWLEVERRAYHFLVGSLTSGTKLAVHCLELFRRSLLYLSPMRQATHKSSQNGQRFIHCVTELRKKGIKFKKREEVGGLQNIQFKDGTLEIPRLVIEDTTRSVFLNLIAFEQCHFNCGHDLILYLIFMDNLINSVEDVGHLHDCKIMKHWLGSDVEVANLFNELGKKVVFFDNGSYLSELSKDVNTYSDNKWNGWMATLEFKYFSSPWSIISLIDAIILLGLTLVQTLYGVFAYYRPGS